MQVTPFHPLVIPALAIKKRRSLAREDFFPGAASAQHLLPDPCLDQTHQRSHITVIARACGVPAFQSRFFESLYKTNSDLLEKIGELRRASPRPSL